VFFYSRAIFEKAGISPNHIETAVLLTGVTNVLCTFLCGVLVDKVGRKPLLVSTMSLMAVDLFLLTTFIRFSHVPLCSALALVCVLLFIVCFAIGLGPIPYIFVAESFKQNSRSAAMSICTFNNWFWNLVLILVFPIMLVQLSGYVFIAFNIIVIFTVVFVALTVSSDQMDAPKKPKGLGLGLGVLQIFCKFRIR
jgi:MFS family permease